MGNKLKKLIMFLVVVLGMTLFANEEQKAPNEIIKDNPEREVTTVESMKVRDHATMSLSVTKKNEKVIEGELDGDRLKVKLPVKGINENTLDRMAKPKEGKRLVVEAKSKINPRMAKMATKDIKKMPTQEEMNNLTVEQIQAMMSNTTGEKEEESQSKNIKNHIATENEEGVNLDILGVNKNENIYVNVEENGKVIDRYRVAIANTVTPRANFSKTTLTGYLTTKVSKLGSSSIVLALKDYVIEGTAYNVRYATFGANFGRVAFKDEFFSEQRNINFAWKNGEVDGKMGIGIRIKADRNFVQGVYPLIRESTGNTIDGWKVTRGASGETFTEMISEPNIFAYHSYAFYDNTGDGTLFFTKTWGSNGKPDAKVNSFRAVHFRERGTDSSISSVDRDYLGYATVTGIAFDLVPKTTGNVNIPGVYQLEENKSGAANMYFKDESPINFSVRDLTIDVGDSDITFGEKIPDANQKKYTAENLDTPTDWTLLPDQSAQISFMKKANSGTLDKLGLFLEVNGQRTQIARYDTNNQGNFYTKTYTQTTSNGTLDQKVQLRVSQNNNEWAKVEYKIQNAGDIKNPPSGNPEFVFYIIQGRRLGDSSSSAISELRRVKYTLKFSRVADSIGNITTTIDPRLNQLTNHWITLGGNANTDLAKFTTDSKYAQLINSKSNITTNKWIASISKVKKGNDSYGALGDYSSYKRFGKNDTAYLAIKNIKSGEGYIIGTEDLTSGNNFARKIADIGTLKIEVRAKNGDDISFDHIMNEAGKDLNKADFTNTEGYKGTGTVTLTGKTLNQEYTLTRGNWNYGIADNEIELQNHTGYATIFAGLVNSTENLAYKYKVSIDGQELGEQIFGPNNNWISTKDGTLQIKLVKNNDVNDKRNIKLKKLKDDDFTKELKIEYYHSSGIKLGQYILTVKNTRTVTPIGDLTTTIDPRLARLEEEWITLGNYSGGTDLANLTSNKYLGLIADTTNTLDEQRTINTIINVSKGQTEYPHIPDNGNGYKRYGTSGNPSVAIKKIKADPSIIDTSVLHNGDNFARKVKDKNTINFKFKAGNELYYSFNHNLVVAGNPNGEAGKFTAEKGYIGATSVNLTRKEIDKTYTLARSGANTNNYEIDISKTTSGWLPTLHGLFNESQNIASYYKIDSGNTIEFGNANNGVDITENGTTLFNIKLTRPEDPSNKKNVQIIKRKDIDFTKTVKIEYYHSSGIKLGEFTVNVSNTKTVTPIGSMSNNIDSRLAQKSTEWISLAGYGHGNIGELEADRYLEFIGITSSTISEENKKRTIISINEVKKGSSKYDEIPNSSDNKTYARYGTSNTPLLGIKKKNPTSTDNNNIGTNISELTGTDFFARKISDTGSVSVEFVATNKNNYSFTHNLVSVSDTSGEPGKFTADRGYIGSANVNLSGKDIETEYTLIRNGETVVGNQIEISGQVGWLPNFGGVVSDYRNTPIVNYYKINNSNPIYFTNNNGHDFGNFNIKLIKPDTVSDKKNIIITKKNDNTYTQEVLIEYYHSSGIKLGEFTLTVTNTRTEKDLGESTVKIDPRIIQVNNEYHWIKLKNGDMFNSENPNTIVGNYTDFVGVPTAFSKAGNNATYNGYTLEEVLEINDSETVSKDAYTLDGIKYTTSSGNNIAAFPTGIILEEFLKVDETSKLVVSKQDISNSTHDKNNKFLISGRKENQVAVFKGNIKEVYLNKTGGEITSSTIDKTQNIFSGSGTLNLAPATVETSYWFDKTGSGELKGNGSNNEIVLKLTPNSDPLNAAGIIPKSKNNRVANKMVLTVGGKEETVNLNGTNLEKELSLGEGKVKIAIDTSGRLVVTKTQEGDIPSTPIEIKYYYKPSTNISTNEIHLGTFTLTVENPVVEIGTRNVKIDKRFVDKDGYNWLLGNNTAKGTINGNTTSNSFTSLFKYEGNFRNLETDTIERALRVDNRPVRGNAPSSADYLDFIVKNNEYHDETAVLNKGTINDLADKVVISKYNSTDSDLDNNRLLNNKFYILAKDNNDKYKIYTGNVTEEIVGNGVISGTGSVIFRAINNGKTYTFNPGVGGSATATTDNTTMTITVNQGGKLLDGRGQSNIQSGNIANKITVSKDGNVSRAGNSATIDGITFGISSDGGLTISKSNSVSLTEDTTYTIKFYYSAESVDVELSTFNLTVKKTEAEDVGDIEFEVDPRLVKISSVDSGSVKWMSGDKMFGSWDTKEDYSNVIYTKNKITNAMTVNYIDTVVGKFRGTGTDYTVFKTAETGGYNIIAFKTGVALNNYLSEKNLMLSPADDQTFETIFEGTDSNKYKAEIILTYATGVSQEGYSGSGVLDISNGIKGTEYLFSAPTNTKTSIANGLSMAVTGNFPNTNGVVTGKKSTSIADSVVVTVNGTTVTPENNTSVIGNKIYKVNNDLKVGLTSNNQIKIIKLARKFNYTGDNKIIIEYKYKDVKLGVFNLEINSDLTEVDLGTLEVKIDNRITQIPVSESWIRLDGEVMNLDSGGIGNYKELIQVGNWSHGANAVGYNANDKLKVVEKINNGEIRYRSGIYARIQTENEAAFPEKETAGNDHILASKFIQLGEESKLVVSKWNVSANEHNGENDFFVTGTKAGSEVEVAYKGNIQEKYRDKNGQESTKVTDISVSATRYNGNGSINLASAEIGTPYSFTKGGSGNISSLPKVTNGRDSNSLLNLVVSNGEKNIDPTSMFNSSKKIANILKVSVTDGITETIKGTMEGKLETGELTIGDGKIKIGIASSGNLLITKTKEGNIPETKINITYYYSPNPNNDSKQKIELGTFTLTVENPVVNVGTRSVKIDKRFADASVETYSWLLGNNKAKVDVNGTNPVDFSSLFKYDSNAIFSNLTDDTIVKALRIDGRSDKVDQSGKYITFRVGNSDRVNEAAVLNEGTIRNLNDEVIVSKNNGATPNLNNKFYILAKNTANRQTIYTGDVTEEIVGDGKTTGSGTLFFKAENDDNTYTFTPGATNTATGTSTDDSELVINVNTDGKLPDGTGHQDIKTGKIANKITVSKNTSTGQNSATSSRATSESETVDNITFGISDAGGLTIRKASTASLDKDTTYTIKFYYSANSNAADDIELSTFDLTIKKTTAEEKGDITFNVDPRLTQIASVANGNVTWLNPNGMFGPWDNTSKKDYTKFLDLNNGVADNIQATIDSVVGREDGVLSDGYIVFKNKKAEPYNDIAFKPNLNLSQYGTLNNIMVSPYEATTFDSTFIDNDGNRYQVDVIVNHNDTVPKDGYSGSGSINMTTATLNTPYSFTAGGTGDVTSKPSGVTLKVAAGKKSLDATGVVTSTDTRIANFMTVQVGSETAQDVNLREDKLETNILGNKIKVGINESGELTLTKLVEGNIDPTSVVINYYYKPSGGNEQSKVKLGEFTLTIENPMITSNTDVTVEIDKRFENVTGYNWLFRDGKVSSDITSGTPAKVSGFEDFFTFSGDLDSQNGAIVKDLGMTNREVKNAGIEADYGYYHLTNKTGVEPWRGEGAVPRSGEMSQLNNLITVSKGNDPDDHRSLENEFSLLFADRANGDRYSIYRGKITEEIKGIGEYSGSGKIKEKDLTQNTKYIFSTKMTKMGTITSDNKDISIVEASGMPVNALGVVSGKTSKVVANKIRVEYKEENESGNITENTIESNGTLSVSYGGLTVGIDSTGGLTLQKTQEKTNITEVVINYLYEVSIGNEKKTVDLGEFTLTIEKDTITIDPDDAFLDFGKMFYDSRDGGETHETRVKKFKVINETGKEISFKVDKTAGEMTSSSNKLELRNISVKKDSNTEFTLQATAVLNKDTKPGSYEGTIEVIVDIITPSNP